MMNKLGLNKKIDKWLEQVVKVIRACCRKEDDQCFRL